MRPLFSSRLRLALASLLLLGLLAAVAVAVDWWWQLPAGITATYVGRESCRECHQQEHDLWTGSYHDLAMDHATAETVLGDFDDCEFTHIAFDDIAELSDGEIRLVLKSVDPKPLALALTDSSAKLKEKLARLMTPEQKAAQKKAAALLGQYRPADVAEVQRDIGDILRRLKASGELRTDFAVTSRMFQKQGKFFVTTDNREGKLETFEVKYVFGVHPLQQYLIEFPDGRIQCLPITWDTLNHKWYHLYPRERIPAGDPLHWTRPLQNWNYMCAECHTTNLRKNYDVASDTYRTTWSEIDVSCETCHGPGSLHVELAESKGIFWDRRYGYGLPRLKTADSHVPIENCAPCHARRRVVYPSFQAGGKLLDHYLPEILDNNLYYADGQILEEDYEYSSFVQSKMYANGVRCTDCHDPHSTKIKFRDNRLCGKCHLPAKYDTPTHHHHPDASQPGTLCVECHMPETKYMVVDARRDHSLRIPRPELSVKLGIPNACNNCHNDVAKGETADWALAQVEKWYGKKNEPAHFAYAIAAGREMRPEAEGELSAVARRKDVRPIVRASAISLLSPYESGEAIARALEGLEDDDELVRTTAVRSLQSLPADEMLRRLGPRLRDTVRSVRTEAARVMTRLPRQLFTVADRAAFDAALKEYLEGQLEVADQAAAHLNMAVVYANMAQEDLDRAAADYEPIRQRLEAQLDGLRQHAAAGEGGKEAQQALQTLEQEAAGAQAEYYAKVRQVLDKPYQAYRQALKIDPQFVPAKINLAMLCDQRGEKAEAERLFREIIAQQPEVAEVQYSLGLLLAEDPQRLAEAVPLLAQAAKLSPENPRIHYNLGLALQKLDRLAEAEQALKAALAAGKNTPAAADFLYALAILYAQQQQWDRAAACAEQLVRLDPANPQWPALLEHFRNPR